MTDSQPDLPRPGGEPQQPPPIGQQPYPQQPPPIGQQPYPQQPPYPQRPYGSQPPYGQPYGAPALMSPEDQRLWATLGHLSGVLFHLLGPLVLFLVVKDRGPYVRRQAAEALNFWITVDIALLVSGLLVLVLIGIVGLVVIPIAAIVLAIVAAVATNRGEEYRYPVNLRLVT